MRNLDILLLLLSFGPKAFRVFCQKSFIIKDLSLEPLTILQALSCMQTTWPVMKEIVTGDLPSAHLCDIPTSCSASPPA